MKNKLNQFLCFKNCATLTFINFWFALFCDSILIYKHFEIKHSESYLYILVSNAFFIIFAVMSKQKAKQENIKMKKINLKDLFYNHYPLLILLAIVTVLAISNFNTLAVYDGHLYYGAFITAFDLFEQNIRTAIGSFILWGHVFIGSALFMAPIETLLKGEMVGAYFMNTVLFDVTLVILYKYLNELFVKQNKWFSTFIVAAFAFMPYSFALITYFCPDFYLELYLVWLMYAYKKDNQLMVSFIGFLLCFTKDTGAFVYGFFMLFVFIFDCFVKQKHQGFKWWKIKNIPFGNFVIWLIPAGLYGVCFFIKEKYQLQVFSGAGSLMFGLNPYDIRLQSAESYILGFRWLILAIAAFALLILIFKLITKKYNRVTNPEYTPGFYSNIATTIALSTMLSVFTLSHCPRYTNPMNVAYAMILAVSLAIIFYNKDVIKNIVALAMASIMLIQVFWTIDPAIRKGCTYINTGNHKTFNIGNLNGCYEPFQISTVGDYYVYNNEYALYSDLIRKTIKHFNPTEDMNFVVFDNPTYEMQIGGIQYAINWDTKYQRQTYASNDHTIWVSSSSDDAASKTPDFGGQDIYVIVMARRKAEKAIKRYEKVGYEVVDAYTASNQYGNITTYHFAIPDKGE